ncbi:YkgJ family cysteine cluster protein [bacterium]|nr:YkgJ family cysteine cluster protein [bacterium]
MIQKKIAAVRRLFWKIDHACALFKLQSGLNCPVGCGECCSKSDIEATILEFLPLADDLSRRHPGMAEALLKQLEQRDGTGPCIFYQAEVGSGSAGSCLEYSQRGMICRLFGFSARSNKYGQKEILTCRRIKTLHPDCYATVAENMGSRFSIPYMPYYQEELQNIDFVLGGGLYPINQAIQSALEMMSLHRFFRLAS